MNRIEKRVCELVSRVSRVAPDQVQVDSDLYRDLGIDSLRALKLVATLETELGVSIPEVELVGLKTPRDIAEKLNRQPLNPIKKKTESSL